MLANVREDSRKDWRLDYRRVHRRQGKGTKQPGEECSQEYEAAHCQSALRRLQTIYWLRHEDTYL